MTDVNGLRTIAFESFKMSFKMIQGKRERHTKLIKVMNALPLGANNLIRLI